MLAGCRSDPSSTTAITHTHAIKCHTLTIDPLTTGCDHHPGFGVNDAPAEGLCTEPRKHDVVHRANAGTCQLQNSNKLCGNTNSLVAASEQMFSLLSSYRRRGCLRVSGAPLPNKHTKKKRALQNQGQLTIQAGSSGTIGM